MLSTYISAIASHKVYHLSITVSAVPTTAGKNIEGTVRDRKDVRMKTPGKLEKKLFLFSGLTTGISETCIWGTASMRGDIYQQHIFSEKAMKTLCQLSQLIRASGESFVIFLCCLNSPAYAEQFPGLIS